MSIQLDYDEARRLLELVVRSDEPAPSDWLDLLERLSAACSAGPKTHIAMMGTAILARAVSDRVDVYALKTRAGTPGAYSARALAKNVLAADAPRLGLHLGVTGREPLNNQPYFRRDRIEPEMEAIIRADGIPAFHIVLEGLLELSDMTSAEALGALRAFVIVRARGEVAPLGSDKNFAPSPVVLTARLDSFVGKRSEGGKRAQAVAAAILSEIFESTVLVTRVNDPDRRFPGDVEVRDLSAPGHVIKAFEVRDKQVTEADIFHLLTKCHARGVSRAGIVCVARNQERLDLRSAMEHAHQLGLGLRVYYGWAELLEDALFLSREAPRVTAQRLGNRIFERLIELEVSPAGLEAWRTIVRELSGP